MRQVICPTGKLAASLSSPFRKKISLSPSGKSALEARPFRATKEGRIAIVTTRGQRDAVDACRAKDERARADGEVVWS
jgi:hypothetical protein